jgi:hypothetical protein
MYLPPNDPVLPSGNQFAPEKGRIHFPGFFRDRCCFPQGGAAAAIAGTVNALYLVQIREV